jgi:hypothetical protein
MNCEERDRLTAIYLTVVAKYNELARHASDLKSEVWRDATRLIREDCKLALLALQAHKKEHG